MQHNSQVESNKTAVHQQCVSLLPYICMYVPDGCSAYSDALGLMVQYQHLMRPSFPQEHNDLS